MKFDRRWLLAPPLLAVILVTGPYAADGGDGRTLVLVFGALAVVLAIATVVTAWGGRATPRPATPRPATPRAAPIAAAAVVRQSIPLDRGARLLVVRFDGRDLLVAEGRDGGIRLLAGADRSPAAPTRRPAAPARTVEIPRPDRAPAARLDGYRALARAGR